MSKSNSTHVIRRIMDESLDDVEIYLDDLRGSVGVLYDAHEDKLFNARTCIDINIRININTA